MRQPFRTAVSLLFFISVSCIAGAQTQRDPVKENGIEMQLLAIDSSAVADFKAGTIALDQENYPLADSLYSIVYQKAPNFEPVIRRLGTIRSSLGKTQEGISLCEKAVSLNRSSDNLIMLASTLLGATDAEGNVSNVNLNRALALLNEGRSLPGADDYEYTASTARVYMGLGDITGFHTTVKDLLARHDDKMISHYFAAIDAAQREEWTTAKDEIEVAGAMGLPRDAVNTFLASGVGTKASTANYALDFLWIVVFWIAGLVLLYIVGALLSHFTLRSLETQLSSTTIDMNDTKLRTAYRSLINFAGVYYYISLPIILILVVVIVCAIFYFCLMAGHIPVGILLALVVGGCATIYGMIRSLLVKVKYADPGRELKPEEAPGLFTLTKEVAHAMNTRPIDEIRITAEIDLAVYERGTWREKMKDKGKRILILGTGVLKDFKQNDFRAVLAHEYGHFSHRDTAGGDVAMRVRSDMGKYAYALAMAGQAVWWNLAFQFLRLYDLIFRRISNGATRLQEVLADHVAAQTYGAVYFQNGLTYVIRRNIEFIKLANTEIEDAKKKGRSFNNLYELGGISSVSLDEEVKKALNRKTSEDDTHPSPVDRFRYVQGLGSGKQWDDTILVRELFVNWDALTTEMTKQIEDRLRKGGR